MRSAPLVFALVAVSAQIARADDVATYEVEGEADAASSDARVAALDIAFVRATQRAVGELVAADVVKAHKPDLDREVYARARLWVAKFQVVSDATDDGRRQLAVSVRIDRDKLRARLAELQIATGATAPTGPAASPDTAAPAHGVIVLIKEALPAATLASFGPGAAAAVPGASAIASALAAGGLSAQPTPASAPAPTSSGDLPLTDDDAIALAASAHGEHALVAGVTVGAAVPVRGIAGTASLVAAHVRLLSVGEHKLEGEGIVAVASTDADPAAAIARALTGAMADAVPAPAHELARAGAFHGDDTPVGEPGVVLIRLAPATPYAMVLAEAKYLAGGKGVRAAQVRRLSPRGWILGVQTADSPDHVAQLAKHPPATDTSVTVKIVGDVIELTLAGAP